MQEVPEAEYGEILALAFKELSMSENVVRASRVKLVEKFVEIWEIDTEVVRGDFQLEVCLYVGFDEFFPLSIPRIYVSPESLQAIGIIPHIDKNGFVCTLHSDSLILDQNNPIGIINECIKIAKNIISKGINGDNASELRQELGAYWTDDDDNYYDAIGYLSLINTYPATTSMVSIFVLKTPYRLIKYVLYNDKDDVSTKLFLRFLQENGCKGREYKALFLADFGRDLLPPFPHNNSDILKLLNEEQLCELKRYINADNYGPEKHIFFLADALGSTILLGWRHKTILSKVAGHRNMDKFEALCKCHKSDRITRILANNYSNNRIENRTSGIENKKYRFLIAGLGSVGSNLLFFLNAMNYPDYKLIDNDALKLENIGRHLLGFNCINAHKVDEVHQYIKNIRPDQSVSINKSSVLSLLRGNIDFFNDCSHAFFATGNQNIENYVIRLINEGQITVPTFLLWVEPYAVGGHCLYVHPHDKVDIGALFENGIYCKNLIASHEYESSNPLLSLQEAGCQSAYTPYSGNDVIMFLSSIYAWMNSIIKNKTSRSSGVRWVGDIKLANNLGLALSSNNIQVVDSFTCTYFEINDDCSKR